MAWESAGKAAGLRFGFTLLAGLAACAGRVESLSDQVHAGAGGSNAGHAGAPATAAGGSGSKPVSGKGGGPGAGATANTGFGGEGGAATESSNGGSAGALTSAGHAGAPMGGIAGAESVAGFAGVAGFGGNGTGCPSNQIRKDGICACPAYAPSFCAVANKCVDFQRDPDHCGDCNTLCGFTNACAAGVCTPDLTELGEVPGCGTLELQMGAGHVYALSKQLGTLSSLAAPVGGDPMSVASGLTGGSAFALDATNAYVATDTTITQVNLTSGAKSVLVNEAGSVSDVAVAAGKIYYTSGTTIKQADSAAPSVGVIVATAADGGVPQSVAAAGGFVFFDSNDSFNVEMDAIVGDEYVKVAASQAELLFGHRGIQSDGTDVFWANHSVNRAAIFADHTPLTIAWPIDSHAVVAFAVDSGKRMTYLATDDGSFEKSSFDAGDMDAIWVARNLPSVTSVVLDASHAYMASGCKVLWSPR